MASIRFPELAEVLQLHRIQVETFGGSHGLRDLGLLQSALAQPRMSFGGNYVHADLAEMAGAYIYHLARNHAFVDGNKRIATATAILFLNLNGTDLIAAPLELADIVIRAASGSAQKHELADFIRRHARPL